MFNWRVLYHLKTSSLKQLLHKDISCNLATYTFPNPRLRKIDQMTSNGDSKITRVLFCGPHFPASHCYTREYLEKYPHIQVKDVPLDAVPNVIADYDICVLKNRRLDAEIISRASKMKLIMQFGVGLEGVDIEASTKHGIRVAKIPGNICGNSASCAEMAIYLILGLLRKHSEMLISVKERRLGEPIGETLLGKTVFIMGFGNIGIDLAKRLRPFNVTILATKRTWTSTDGNNEVDLLVDKKGGIQDIYGFAKEADIVVICLSLNNQTAGIVNEKFISCMKKGALLVNIARGGVLDYKAVYNGLDSGHLGGLGIDVAWTEPFDPDDDILKFGNVIITPHVAGVTEYSYRIMAKVVGDTALELHAGTPLTQVEFVN